MREAKREHLKYKTIAWSYTLKQAQEFDEMFYFIVNERNKSGRAKQADIRRIIADVAGGSTGNLTPLKFEKLLPNLRPLVKTNNQVLFDIIKEEYDRQKGLR